MAREYLEIQTEMAYLSRYLKKLEDKLNSTEQQRQQIQQLVNEKVGGGEKVCVGNMNLLGKMPLLFL